MKLDIPDYVQDEIDKYKYKKLNGNSGISTYHNIFALIRLAVVNNRITENQAKEIEKIVNNI